MKSAYRRFRDLLPNGLRVVTVEVPHLHSALLAVYARVGSRHETPATNGVSHFLEHMFFRGTERFPDPKAMTERVEEAGGDLNAVTMRDSSFYYTSLHPSRLEVGFEVLGDMLTAPRMREVELEREVILEEMMDEVDARGRDVDLGNLSGMLIFGDHPLALKIAGTRRSVRRIDARMLRRHHRRFYGASNLVLCAAGPISRGRVVRLAQQAFGRLPRGEPARERTAAPRSEGPSFRFIEQDEAQTELRATFCCTPEGSPDHDALIFARSILAEGFSSRLQQEVVQRRGLAYSINAVLDSYHDLGLFEVEAACSPSKAPAVFAELMRQLERLRDEPLSAQELARAKRRYRIGLDFALDDLNELAGWYGGVELFRVPESLEARTRRLEAVSARQIQEAARRTFRRDNLFVCVVGAPRARSAERLEAAARRALA